jgi:hypothetical protein
VLGAGSTLETTQWQIDGFFGQLLFKCYLPEVASVGDELKICPWVASRVGRDFISVNIQFEYDPDELAKKITRHLVHEINSRTYVW